MRKLKLIPLQIAVTSALVSLTANATGIEDYLDGVEEISAKDVAEYLSKYEIPDTEPTPEAVVAQPEVVPVVAEASKSIQKLSRTPEKVREVIVRRSKADLENLVASMSGKSSSALDSLYLRNIPQSSVLEFNDRLLLLPNETTAFFQGGNRIYTKPSVGDSNVLAFCMFSLSKTGQARKVAKGRSLVIEEIQEQNSVFMKPNSDDEILVRVTKLLIDNPNLKEVVCIGAGQPKPLVIGDLIKATGGLVSIKTQDYIEI
jgi:hypothetical protein